MAIYTRYDGTWVPEGVTNRRRRPHVGELIAFEYAAWRVIHCDVDDLRDGEEKILKGIVPSYRDQAQPYRLALRREMGPAHERENSAQDIAFRIPARYFRGWDLYETGRVPLCSCCSNPWPCRNLINETAAAAEARKLEHELKLLPGCCPACQEPITARQHTIEFPGEYVRNPLGPVDVQFHLRRACRQEAARYEEAWVAADPTRPRSLLTLRCAGHVVTCADGYSECFGADDSDCPSIHARHRSYSACYTQTRGCGRQCGGTRHGCHPVGRPKDLRP